MLRNVLNGKLLCPTGLPPIPGTEELGWPATSLALEAIMRFPWAAGRHPCLDAAVVTGGALMRWLPEVFRPRANIGLLLLEVR